MAAKKCPDCDGCGKLASNNSKPWTQFAGLAYNSDAMALVRSGEVTPVTCKACGGSGFEKDVASKPIK